MQTIYWRLVRPQFTSLIYFLWTNCKLTGKIDRNSWQQLQADQTFGKFFFKEAFTLSRMSALLVLAKTTTWEFDSNPSIETKSWFKVWSNSPLPPPPAWLASDLLRPIASISSMKIIAGDCLRASSNKDLTLNKWKSYIFFGVTNKSSK